MKLSKPSQALSLGWVKLKISSIEYEKLASKNDYDEIEKLTVYFTSEEVQQKTTNGEELLFLSVKQKTTDGGKVYEYAADIENLVHATGAVDLSANPSFDSQHDFQVLVGCEVLAYRYKKKGDQYSNIFKQRFIPTGLDEDELESWKVEAEMKFDGYMSYISNNSWNTNSLDDPDSDNFNNNYNDAAPNTSGDDKPSRANNNWSNDEIDDDLPF